MKVGIENFGLSLAQWQDINRQVCQALSLISSLDHSSAGKAFGNEQSRVAIRRGGDVHLQSHTECMMGQCANEPVGGAVDASTVP